MKVEARFALVLICFLLSGFSALIYQTAWTRQFALVFGTSELAVATVLAAYMGGLAAGAAAATRWVERITRPVFVYGVLELGIALSALAVPFAIHGSTWLYVRLFGGVNALPESGGLAHASFYLACSFAILLLPTGLMGATLPLLARHAVRRPEEIGSRIGLLYATNTAGAVGGTVAAGFFLLPKLGLAGTIHVGVATNLLIFGLALLLGRSMRPLQPAARASRPATSSTLGRWMPLFILISGAVSFSYEVLWTRLLGHLFGGSTFAFATMLASFLSGIAIGSAVASRIASSPERATRGFAVAQIGTALLSLAAFFLCDQLPGLSRTLTAALGTRTAADAVISALTLLPAAVCIGATLPFAIRVCARDAEDAGRASASMLAWNTLGAILGAIGSGFFLIPAVGFEIAMSAAVATNLALALLAAHPLLSLQRSAAYAGVAFLLCVVLLPPDPPWQLLRTSPLGGGAKVEEIKYYAVGRSATVLLAEQDTAWRLRTNGLPESRIQPLGMHPSPNPFAQWLGAGASIARPEAKRMLMVGLGGATALEFVPSLVESIDVVELEPEVVEANRSVAQLRRKDPLSDPRVRLIENDARGALLLAAGEKYDIIVSQPSHPWTGGASHLYSREFFALARARLAQDGVLAQWMARSFISRPLLRSLIATLGDVFDHVHVYRPGSKALLFLASNEPLDLPASSIRAVEAAPDEFATLGIHRPEDVVIAQLFDASGSRAFAAGAELITDNRNTLQMRSLQVSRNPRRQIRPGALYRDSRLLTAPDIPWDRVELVRRLARRRLYDRAERIASYETEPAKRAAADGILAAARGKRAEGRRLLEEAIALDPTSAPARAALLRLRRQAATQVDPELETLLATFPASEVALVAAWRADAADDDDRLRSLEPQLASFGPTDPLFIEAIRLRVAWRLADGGAAEIREALVLADSLIPVSGIPEHWVLRARVCAAAGMEDAALATLFEAASRAENSANWRKVSWDAIQVLESLGESAGPIGDRERLRSKLEDLHKGGRRSERTQS